MANYLVTDTDLTSVANAIRTKGETSELLEFPAGFVSAVDNVPTPKLSKVLVQNDLSDSVGVFHSLKTKADGTISVASTFYIEGGTTGELYTSFGTTSYGCTGYIWVRVPASSITGLNISLSGTWQTVKELGRETSGNYVSLYLYITSSSLTEYTPTLRFYTSETA